MIFYNILVRPFKTQNHKHPIELPNLVEISDSPRILQQTDEVEDSEDETEPSTDEWQSKLTEAEKISYKKMINLKNSFAASLPYLPKHFTPEDLDYIVKVFQIMINFFYFVLAIGFLVLVYLILRFCCKKCVGPVKISQITRSYRNFTWIILSKNQIT
jgi:hypothetical protein